MGIGDEIMASGQARTEYLRTGQRVKIFGKSAEARWSDIWDGLEWIARPEEAGDFAAITSGNGCRPYLKYPWVRRRQSFTEWRARDHVGSIALSPSEVAFADRIAACHGPFVLIEPNVKTLANRNKDWGFHRWQRLVALTPDIRWLQCGPRTSRRLRGVAFAETPSFRLAAAVLARATLSVVPEGGLHHAAAALDRPAVVLWGGVVPVETLGYPWHDNIADDSPDSPCGNWQPCQHCARVWQRITPEMVAARVRSALLAAKAA